MDVMIGKKVENYDDVQLAETAGELLDMIQNPTLEVFQAFWSAIEDGSVKEEFALRIAQWLESDPGPT